MIDKEYEPLLIERDPGRFFKTVVIDDEETRLRSLPHNPGDVLSCELVRYAMRGDGATARRVAQVYVHGFVPQVSEAQRYEVYWRVCGVVERLKMPSIVLMPFLMYEPWDVLVGSAAVDMVSLSSPDAAAAMKTAREIVERIEKRTLANRGAAFGGLLHLGDPRVLEMLKPVRDGLSDEEVGQAMRCRGNLLFGPTIGFYLTWLSDLKSSGGERFARVAKGLADYLGRREVDQVFSGERPFPLASLDSPVDGMKHLPLETVVPLLEKGFRHLAEAQPQAMQCVMEALASA